MIDRVTDRSIGDILQGIVLSSAALGRSYTRIPWGPIGKADFGGHMLDGSEQVTGVLMSINS